MCKGIIFISYGRGDDKYTQGEYAYEKNLPFSAVSTVLMRSGSGLPRIYVLQCRQSCFQNYWHWYEQHHEIRAYVKNSIHNQVIGSC